jgi:hemoglobin
MSESEKIPTVAEHAGGLPAFERLTKAFYAKVAKDPILAPVFAQMGKDHPQHVAAFIAQGFGAGPTYSGARSENAAMRDMVQHHVGRKLTEQQRHRWVTLLYEAADEVGLPADPEFRSAFAAHIEWGSRIAVMNSALEENPTGPNDHVPRWDWGSVRGPFDSVGSICSFPTDEKIIP